MASSSGPQAGGYGPSRYFPDEDETENDSVSIEKELNVAEAKSILNRVLDTDIVPFLWGPPGVGKSSIVREICADKEWELIDLRLSLVNPVDLRGLPSIDKKKKIANWLPPSFLPPYDYKKKGVLFLDEINLAPLSVQHAAYQLILDKQVGEYRFPPHWKIIAAGNRETDKANVYKLPSPLANRFIHFTVLPDIEAWVDWARGQIREEIIAFLIGRPSLLFQMPKNGDKAFPSPRSWVFVSDLMNTFQFNGGLKVNEELDAVIKSAVGPGAGQEFIEHLKSFDLQKISEEVDKFIKTGKIKLPKSPISTRYAIVTAALDAFRRKKVNKKKFEKLIKQLNAEETATVRRSLTEEEIKKAGGNPAHFTYLEAPLDKESKSVLVNSTDVFKQKEGYAEIMQDDKREIVKYKFSESRSLSLERGQNSTAPEKFDAGAFVKRI